LRNHKRKTAKNNNHETIWNKCQYHDYPVLSDGHHRDYSRIFAPMVAFSGRWGGIYVFPPWPGMERKSKMSDGDLPV